MVAPYLPGSPAPAAQGLPLPGGADAQCSLYRQGGSFAGTAAPPPAAADPALVDRLFASLEALQASRAASPGLDAAAAGGGKGRFPFLDAALLEQLSHLELGGSAHRSVRREGGLQPCLGQAVLE